MLLLLLTRAMEVKIRVLSASTKFLKRTSFYQLQEESSVIWTRRRVSRPCSCAMVITTSHYASDRSGRVRNGRIFSYRFTPMRLRVPQSAVLRSTLCHRNARRVKRRGGLSRTRTGRISSAGLAKKLYSPITMIASLKYFSICRWTLIWVIQLMLARQC